MGRQRAMALAVVAGLSVLGGRASIAAAQQGVTLEMSSQNGSGIIGQATLTETSPGRMRVEIRVDGAGPGPRPAHIHEGTCANLNPEPKFSLAAATDGVSTTEVDGTLQQVTSSPHAVHLHKSPSEMPLFVSCADIRMGEQTETDGQRAAAGQAPATQPAMAQAPLGGPATMGNPAMDGAPSTLPRAGDAHPLTGTVAGLAIAGLALTAGGVALQRGHTPR